MKKKILSTMLLLAVIFTVMTPVQSYACDCGCNCKTSSVQETTAKKKSNALEKKSNALLKPVKKYAKSYSWATSTKLSRETSKKRITKVVFKNDVTHYHMTVYIRATKKNGKVDAEWIFRRDGKWLRTNAELIKGVLKEDGKKVSKKPIADPNPIIV